MRINEWNKRPTMLKQSSSNTESIDADSYQWSFSPFRSLEQNSKNFIAHAEHFVCFLKLEEI